MPQAAYEDAIANLSTLIPELLGQPGHARRKFSLEEIGVLCSALGDPQKDFPSVLVAGTNGKGSTSSTLASIAREAGLRVGLYTSPHLERVNERIRLLVPEGGAAGESHQDGPSNLAGFAGDIPDDDFARLYFRVHDAAQQTVLDGKLAALPSYFELLTALAFLYFSESRVDLAVLEVGMGGRLDATNLVEPVLSVITDISLDHQEWLGSTIDRIAKEKAGILRVNGTMITLPQHPQANQALGEVATELGVRGVSAAEYMPASYAERSQTDPMRPYATEALGGQITVDSPLKGAHQHRNIALAIAAAVELKESRGLPITAKSIERGIRATYWPGRLESVRLADGTEFVLDVAHNPAGAWALRAALSADSLESHLDSAEGSGRGDGRHGQCLIFACLRDKPLVEMTQILFPIFDHVVLAPIHSPRAREVADLLAAAEATGVPSQAAGTVEEAIAMARAKNPARIVVSGSLYLVGEARHILIAHALQDCCH